jgi:hypothetical protein
MDSQEFRKVIGLTLHVRPDVKRHPVDGNQPWLIAAQPATPLIRMTSLHSNACHVFIRVLFLHPKQRTTIAHKIEIDRI